jgi:hypothetical protein
MTCGPSHPSVSHQAPYPASHERTPGLCLRSPSRFPRASDLAGMSDWAPARLAEPQASRSGWKGRATGSDPGIKAPPSSFLISVKHGNGTTSIHVLILFCSPLTGWNTIHITKSAARTPSQRSWPCDSHKSATTAFTEAGKEEHDVIPPRLRERVSSLFKPDR